MYIQRVLHTTERMDNRILYIQNVCTDWCCSFNLNSGNEIDNNLSENCWNMHGDLNNTVVFKSVFVIFKFLRKLRRNCNFRED